MTNEGAIKILKTLIPAKLILLLVTLCKSTTANIITTNITSR